MRAAPVRPPARRLAPVTGHRSPGPGPRPLYKAAAAGFDGCRRQPRGRRSWPAAG